jgi:hypothetical protein
MSLNRPKADTGGFYIFNLVLLKMSPNSAERRQKRIHVLNLKLFNNEHLIGRRPIKGYFIFLFYFVENEPQSAEGR